VIFFFLSFLHRCGQLYHSVGSPRRFLSLLYHLVSCIRAFPQHNLLDDRRCFGGTSRDVNVQMIADDSHKDKLCAGGYMQAVRYCKV